jgi:hypothetical protein
VIEGIDRIPTATLERLLKHIRSTGGRVILREPARGAGKPVSGILPQLLDLNRQVNKRHTVERRPTQDHGMRFMH